MGHVGPLTVSAFIWEPVHTHSGVSDGQQAQQDRDVRLSESDQYCTQILHCSPSQQDVSAPEYFIFVGLH